MVGVHQHDQPMIELRRLHRFFGNTKAVNDVSFEVGKGQVFGYIGPNGAGKTTSMRILATLELPSYGDAMIDGLSVVNDPDLVRKEWALCLTVLVPMPISIASSTSTSLLGPTAWSVKNVAKRFGVHSRSLDSIRSPRNRFADCPKGCDNAFAWAEPWSIARRC